MDGIILQLNPVSVGTGDANRKCWYPQCPRPVLDLVFRKQTKDVVLEWLLLLSSFTSYLMFLFIVEIRRHHRTSWCSVCDTKGCAHFSGQTVVSPSKQVNSCATSSIDLVLERGTCGRILLGIPR